MKTKQYSVEISIIYISKSELSHNKKHNMNPPMYTHQTCNNLCVPETKTKYILLLCFEVIKIQLQNIPDHSMDELAILVQIPVFSDRFLSIFTYRALFIIKKKFDRGSRHPGKSTSDKEEFKCPIAKNYFLKNHVWSQGDLLWGSSS